MRSTRLLSLVGLSLLPAIAGAQEKNPFTDSWYWGAKGGLVQFNTSVARTNAPVIGAEWLITRSKFALYVALDQAYFGCGDPPCADPVISTVDDAPTRGVVRRVDIRDMRRFTVAMNMYPKVWMESIRPYFGLGYALNMVVRATSEGTQFANSSARDTVLQRIEDAKTRGSVIGTFGVQVDYRRFAPFIQVSTMPTRGKGTFLLNGEGFTYYLEAGLRYNFGSAIEKLK
jgi:hypothetical protein